MATMHIEIPPALQARAWGAKLSTGRDIQDLVIDALDAYLDTDYAEQATGESRIKFSLPYRLFVRLQGIAIVSNQPWETLVQDALEMYVEDMEDGDA